MDPVGSTRAAYIVLFSLSGVVGLVSAFVVRTRYEARGTETLSYALAGVGLWALNSAARTAVSDPLWTHVLLSTEMFVTVATAAFWFVFASEYTNLHVHRRRSVRLTLYALVTAAFVVPLTNPGHGLMWESVTPVGEPFLHYDIVKGPAHYVLSVSGYVLVGWGLYFLLKMLRTTSHTKAMLSLIVGFLLLVSANATPYVIDTAITHSTTITPLGATGFCVMSAAAIRYNLLSVTPVARTRVFGAMMDPIVMLDRNRNVIDHNDAFSDAFCDGEDVSHTKFDEACHELVAQLDDPFSGPEHVEYTDVNGSDRVYAVRPSRLDSGPHVLGHALVFRDITDLLSSQRELSRQNTQLDEFADSVAHDLRNPLSVMIGHVDLLRAHLDQVAAGNADYDHHLASTTFDKMDQSTRRIRDIITDFVKVTREGKSVRGVEPVDFEEVVRRTASDRVPHAEVRVRESGKFYASPSRASTILDVVFRNIAERATDDLVVTARLTDDGFEIEDSGESVPPDEAPQLLEYGFTTRFRGRGLGLSVAKTLAEAHQWSISLEADGVNGLRVIVEGVTTHLDASTVEEIRAENP